jgi:tetratricopeptide (TPR) repeat protein
MKRVITRITFCSFLIILSFAQLSFAQTKLFIKEYTYQASEDDSRNSSRVIALREVKRLLLEELGTYLESETEVKNFQLTKDQITTLTAGIVQTEIVSEKWDGRVYWLNAKITADSEKVVQSINALRKDREKTKELEAMKQKSDDLLKEVERLRKDLSSVKGGNRSARKAAYDKSINELSAAEWIEKGHAVQGRHDDFKEAFDAFSRAIELDPDNINAYYFRARISEKNQAMSDYYKLLTIEPKNSESHLVRAWTYKELEQRDSALQEFGKAIEKAQGNKEKATAYYDRGRYYVLLRPRPRAKPAGRDIPNAIELSIDDFSRAIEFDPQEASFYADRGASYWHLKKHDLALQDYNTVIRLNPNSAGYYASRGHLLHDLGKPELAVADFSRAIELAPKDSFFITNDYMMRAIIYEEMGKFDSAIRDWTTLIGMEPKESSNYGFRASCYYKLGKYDLAIKDYTAAITLNPKTPSYVYYGRATAYAAGKNTGKAIADLKKAIQLDPSYKDKARKEPKFDSLRKHRDFIKLLGP